MAESTPSTSQGQAAIDIVPAKAADIPRIKELVDAAYTKYIERIGKPPAPMTADYHELLRTHQVSVLRTATETSTVSGTSGAASASGPPSAGGGLVVGSIVLSDDPEADAIKINNVVVDPDSQGKGYGRVLMQHAEDEAKRRGRSALMLYTNVKMHENFGLYAKMGFVVTERKMEDGFERAYFRKDLV